MKKLIFILTVLVANNISFAQSQNQNDSIFEQKKSEFSELKKECLKTKSGLEYIITRVGDGGKPSINEEILISYAGYYKTGNCFDTNLAEISKKFKIYDANRDNQNGYAPLKILYLEKMNFIEGFSEAIKLLNYNDKATIFIPYNLAYGESGNKFINPKTDLIFEIEIIKPN